MSISANSSDFQHHLVVFDCDGTLVSSQNQIVRAMDFAWSRANLPKITHDQVRHAIGLPLQEALRMLLAQQNLSHDDVDIVAMARDFRSNCDEYLMDANAKDLLFDGIDDLLRKLQKSGILLAIATGMGRGGLCRLLQKLEYEGLFFALRTADDGPGKPAPDILLDLIDQAGVNAQDVLMIGDTTWDIKMARNAKAIPIGVSWGNHPRKKLEIAGADIVVDDTDTLYDTILRYTDNRN